MSFKLTGLVYILLNIFGLENVNSIKYGVRVGQRSKAMRYQYPYGLLSRAQKYNGYDIYDNYNQYSNALIERYNQYEYGDKNYYDEAYDDENYDESYYDGVDDGNYYDTDYLEKIYHDNSENELIVQQEGIVNAVYKADKSAVVLSPRDAKLFPDYNPITVTQLKAFKADKYEENTRYIGDIFYAQNNEQKWTLEGADEWGHPKKFEMQTGDFIMLNSGGLHDEVKKNIKKIMKEKKEKKKELKELKEKNGDHQSEIALENEIQQLAVLHQSWVGTLHQLAFRKVFGIKYDEKYELISGGFSIQFEDGNKPPVIEKFRSRSMNAPAPKGTKLGAKSPYVWAFHDIWQEEKDKEIENKESVEMNQFEKIMLTCAIENWKKGETVTNVKDCFEKV